MESKDKIVWAMSKDGKYTCKSGYKFLKEESELDRQEFNQDHDKDLWKGVWALQTPNKPRNFVWRACRNTLPSKKNLVRRTIIRDPTWDRCSLAPEDPLHALWTCTKLDVVWADSELWDFRSQTQFQDLKQLTAWVLKHAKNPDLFATIAWAIWNQWNHIRLHQVLYPGYPTITMRNSRPFLQHVHLNHGRPESPGNHLHWILSK